MAVKLIDMGSFLVFFLKTFNDLPVENHIHFFEGMKKKKKNKEKLDCEFWKKTYCYEHDEREFSHSFSYIGGELLSSWTR